MREQKDALLHRFISDIVLLEKFEEENITAKKERKKIYFERSLIYSICPRRTF